MALEMWRHALWCILLLSTLVASQNTASTSTSSSKAAASSASTSSSSLSSSSSQPAQTHTVSVGKANNKFQPDTVLARAGDVIEFQFFPPNHSVARAQYEHACVPYEYFGVDQVGFFSGFHPVDAILESPPLWQLRINDTDPIFFYCAALGSCINYAMVGVINPNASVSLEKQKINAEQSDYMLAPGEPLPDNEASPSSAASSGSSSATVGTASSSSTSSSTPTSATSAETGSYHLSTGAIVGIVVGGVIAIAALGALLFLLGRNTALLQSMRRDRPASYATGASRNQGYDAPPYSQDRYGSPPPPSMSDHKPYEVHQKSTLAKLPSPPLSTRQGPFNTYSDGQENDEARRQTITPPPSNMHSELDAAQQHVRNQPSWNTLPIHEER